MCSVHAIIYAKVVCDRNRVPTPPGKSWIFCKISRPWKVLENGFGPGKVESPGNFNGRSWKVLEFFARL